MRVIIPKDYQKEALATNHKARANGVTKITNVLASGLGKTILAGLDIREYLSSTDLPRPRVLVLNANIQLLKQIEEEFRKKIFGHEYSYGVFNGVRKTAHTTDFLFATFDSMCSHLEEFRPDDFGYIFIDEAHHAQANTYSRVIDYFCPEQQLSVTATPIRMDGKDITENCGPIVYSLELEQAIAQGLTAGVDYRLCLDEIEKIQTFLDDGEKVSWNKLNTEIFVPKRDEEIIATVQRDTEDLTDPTTIYFCRSIQHANRIAKLLPNATVIHSELSVNEVDSRLRKFRRGEIKTIVAVDMLNEGIDIPRTDVVVFLRSTRSWTIFLQQLGRGLRLTANKEAVRVYDFVGTATALEKVINLERCVNEYARKREAKEKPNFELKIKASKFHINKLDIVDLLTRAKEDWWTVSKISDALREVFRFYGNKVPTNLQYKEYLRSHPGSLPSTDTISKKIGCSQGEAFFKLGIVDGLSAYHRGHKWTDDELSMIGQLALQWAETDDLSIATYGHYRAFLDNQIPTSAYIIKKYGAWEKYKQRFGFRPTSCQRFSAVEIAVAVINAERALQKRVTIKAYSDYYRGNTDVPSATTIKKRGGIRHFRVYAQLTKPYTDRQEEIKLSQLGRKELTEAGFGALIK